MLKKIISGGQTGIDQLGLYVARENGIMTGGTAPYRYKTETGSNYELKSVYYMTEVSYRDKVYFENLTGRYDAYTPRTYCNARDSDGTVYFSTDTDSPGLKTTRRACGLYDKPFILNPDYEKLVKFIEENNIEVLNVAGNRESKLKQSDKKKFEEILDRVCKHFKET